MKFHPYAEVFPLIEGPAFDELVTDIKTFGLREKIWLYDKKILDGRNRFLACQKAKVTPEYRTFKGTESGALALVVSTNMQRRHMSDSQRAMASARISTLRQHDNQHSEGLPIGRSSEMMNVSARSTKRAKKVIEKGSKALQQAVDSGHVTVSKAAAVVDLPKPKQLAAAKAPSSKEVVPIGTTSIESPFDKGIPEYTPDEADEAAALERATAEIDKSMAVVMASDDRFPALQAEVKRLAGLLSISESSRDHYQNQAGQAVRLLKARDREVESLKKKLAKAESDLKKLTERMEAA